jgi:HEPN domain-containing protein
MPAPRDGASVPSSWLAKAEGDLVTAEHTLTLGERCPCETVAFHAQQCAEKCLKALIVRSGRTPPRTHDIRLLVQQQDAVIRDRLDGGALVALNRYAVEARYPGFWEPVVRHEAEAAVAAARGVLVVARELIG